MARLDKGELAQQRQHLAHRRVVLGHIRQPLVRLPHERDLRYEDVHAALALLQRAPLHHPVELRVLEHRAGEEGGPQHARAAVAELPIGGRRHEHGGDAREEHVLAELLIPRRRRVHRFPIGVSCEEHVGEVLGGPERAVGLLKKDEVPQPRAGVPPVPVPDVDVKHHLKDGEVVHEGLGSHREVPKVRVDALHVLLDLPSRGEFADFDESHDHSRAHHAVLSLLRRHPGKDLLVILRDLPRCLVGSREHILGGHCTAVHVHLYILLLLLVQDLFRSHAREPLEPPAPLLHSHFGEAPH
mmetsp:Transcript_24694/g.78098  ORF Transcript_24694/g.78098 Transcript_24694/m.78098 type:complete len:299 (-) Transcript_24694:5407-6303(-)